jgi:hypothetical protein
MGGCTCEHFVKGVALKNEASVPFDNERFLRGGESHVCTILRCMKIQEKIFWTLDFGPGPSSVLILRLDIRPEINAMDMWGMYLFKEKYFVSVSTPPKRSVVAVGGWKVAVAVAGTPPVAI